MTFLFAVITHVTRRIFESALPRFRQKNGAGRLVVEDAKTPLAPPKCRISRLQHQTKKIISKMYVLHANPSHLMTWRFVRVSEKFCIQIFVAQAFADFVRNLLLLPFWTLTTARANISLLIVEFDEVITVLLEWLVTKLVSVVFVVICERFFPSKLPAELPVRSIARKHFFFDSFSARNTSHILVLIIRGADRSQNEGSIEYNVVVFNLIVMTKAQWLAYMSRVVAVAVGPGKPVTTDKSFRNEPCVSSHER